MTTEARIAPHDGRSPAGWPRRAVAACRAVGDGVLDWVYPRDCAVCGTRVADREMQVCWDCLAAFPVITSPFCSLCGDPADGRVDHDYECAWCARTRPAFERARSAVRFRGPARQALHAFKYGRLTALRGDLARLLAATVRTHYDGVRFDAVTAVPLFPRRERARTYNQADLLVGRLARELDLRDRHRYLARVRDTPTQTELTAPQRQANVRGAFAVRHAAWVRGRAFLLVDDVMTTGATVHECARVLKQHGAVSVHVVTVARG